jgi:hypothetical protein
MSTYAHHLPHTSEYYIRDICTDLASCKFIRMSSQSKFHNAIIKLCVICTDHTRWRYSQLCLETALCIWLTNRGASCGYSNNHFRTRSGTTTWIALCACVTSGWVRNDLDAYDTCIESLCTNALPVTITVTRPPIYESCCPWPRSFWPSFTNKIMEGAYVIIKKLVYRSIRVALNRWT